MAPRSKGPEYPDGSGPASLRSRHLLLVSSAVDVAQVQQTIVSRVPHAQLEADGYVQLGRRSSFVGPYELTMEDAVDAGVPMPWTVAYMLQAPVEREDPPPPDADDRDGFAVAFPEGLPWGEEGQALRLLIGMARRLSGAVRIAHGPLMQPDTARTVDLLIHTPTWLDPRVAHGVVARIAPGAQLAVEPGAWHGTGEFDLSRYNDPLTTDELRALRDAADAHDAMALRGEDSIDAYAVVADLDADGAVEVLIHVAEPGEPAVTGQPWAERPYTSYEVRWSCPQPEERERRLPSQQYLASRERVRPVVLGIARALLEVTGGVVTDEEGFLLDRYTL